MDIDLSALTGLSKLECVTVHRGDSPKYCNESLLWAHIRDEINASGLFDVVKKCPAKDGHLTNAPYYIRDRKWEWCLHDPDAAIRGLHREFNHGKCTLVLHQLREAQP